MNTGPTATLMSEHWDQLQDEDPEAHEVLQKVAATVFTWKDEPAPLEPVQVDPEQVEGIELLEVGELEVEGEEMPGVSFSDEYVRVEYISRHAAGTIVEDWDDPAGLAQAFSDLQHRGTRLDVRQEVNRRVMQLLATEYDKDIVGKTAEVATLKSSGERHPVMDMYFPLSEALPSLEIDSQHLADNLGPILERTAGGKMLGKTIHGAVKELAEQSSDLAEELYSAFIARPDSPVVSLAANALLGLSSHDLEDAHHRALELTRSDEPVIVRVGIGVLGRLDYPDDGDLLASSMDRLSDLKEWGDPEIDYVLAQAYGNLVEETDEAKEALVELSSRPDPRTQYHITQALYSIDDALQEPWVHTLLVRLAGAGVEDTTALDNLDLHLSQLASDSPDVVVEVLGKFASSPTDGNLTEVFDSSVSRLHEAYPEKFEATVTEWFASSDPRLHLAAADLADHHFHATDTEEQPVFALSEDVLESLALEEVMNVLQRVVGYVSGSRSLASLVSSVLRRDPCPEELQQFVADLLVGHVLYNYPGEAREYLDRRLDADDVLQVEEEVIREACNEIDAYFDELGELSPLKELRPPSTHLSQIRRARQQQQSKAMEKAREGSVFMSLVESVPLKYGDQFYRIGDEGPTEPAPLGKISSGFEIPRGELIDPVGQAYKRLHLRAAHSLDEDEPDSSS